MAAPASTVRALAQGLGVSTSTAYRRLRSGRVPGAVRRGRRWQISQGAVTEAYAERADQYFAARAAVPLSAHMPDPRPELGYRFRYQFVLTIELIHRGGRRERFDDFSYMIVVQRGERKPTSARLWALLRQQVRERYLEDPETYDPKDLIDTRLIDAHVIHAYRG